MKARRLAAMLVVGAAACTDAVRPPPAAPQAETAALAVRIDPPAEPPATDPDPGAGRATTRSEAAPAQMPLESGSEEAQIAKLKPKLEGGAASMGELRMLKALCAHVGDLRCRDRAARAMVIMRRSEAP